MKRDPLTKSIEESLNQISDKYAKECLCELSKSLTDKQREKLFRLLLDYQSSDVKPETNEARGFARRMSQELVDEKLILFRNWLDQIENGELRLEADGYEDYSGDYWGRDWVWEYNDPDNVGGKLQSVISFAQECVNDRRYREALDLFDRILEVAVEVENDWEDFQLGLEELNKEQILTVDLSQLALMILYTNYQVQEAVQRAEKLYAYFTYSFFKDIHVEDMLRMGREQLPDEGDFWREWIALLSEKAGDLEARLLKEAVLYYRGTDGLVELAGKDSNRHPSLYLSAMKEYERNHEYEKMEIVADEALERLEKNLRIRGKIALLAASAASCNGNSEKMKSYWYEAYFSDATVMNFLRLFTDRDCAVTYGMQAKELLKTMKKAERYIPPNMELEENVLDGEAFTYLSFFAGEFKNVRNACKNPEGSLGWSDSFIKKGVHLFMLYLFDNSTLGVSISLAADEFTHRFEFDRGTEGFYHQKDLAEKLNRNTIFWQAFQDWRKYFPMDKQQKTEILVWLEKIVDQRVHAIVGGKFRHHYDSAAQLIGELGDVKESLGEAGEKQRLLLKYKKEFARHSSFHGALRTQGGHF